MLVARHASAGRHLHVYPSSAGISVRLFEAVLCLQARAVRSLECAPDLVCRVASLHHHLSAIRQFHHVPHQKCWRLDRSAA